MIIYFSGTGNSRYIANRIADNIRDELIDANDKIKRRDTRTIKVNDILLSLHRHMHGEFHGLYGIGLEKHIFKVSGRCGL